VRTRPLRAARTLAAAAVLLASSSRATLEGAQGGSLRGEVETRPIVYRTDGAPDAQAFGRTHLAWENRLAGRWLFRAIGDVDLDARGEVDRGPLYDDSERSLRRPPVRFEELTVTWTARRFDLAAGRMMLPWGRADGFNPTDNLTPWDSLDPLDRERLSSWAVRGRHDAGPVTVEWDVLPRPGVSRLPLLGGRWFPLPDRVGNPSPLGPRTQRLDWRDGTESYPSASLSNAALGLKLDYRAASWEGSLSRYDGWDDQPVLLADPGIPRQGGRVVPVALDRVQPTLRSTGGDVAWIVGRFALRAEASRNERGAPADTRFDFFALEGEWTRGDWRVIAGWADIRGEAASATTTALFDQGALPALMLHVERSVPTGTGASIRLISNLDGDGEMIRAEISWPFAGSWRAAAGVDLIDGPEGTFLGAFRRNDRAVFRLRWSFARAAGGA